MNSKIQAALAAAGNILCAAVAFATALPLWRMSAGAGAISGHKPAMFFGAAGYTLLAAACLAAAVMAVFAHAREPGSGARSAGGYGIDLSWAACSGLAFFVVGLAWCDWMRPSGCNPACGRFAMLGVPAVCVLLWLSLRWQPVLYFTMIFSLAMLYPLHTRLDAAGWWWIEHSRFHASPAPYLPAAATLQLAAAAGVGVRPKAVTAIIWIVLAAVAAASAGAWFFRP